MQHRELKGLLVGGPSVASATLNNTKMQEAMEEFRPHTSHGEVILPEHTPISEQVGGSCVANAFVDGLEILQGIRDPKRVTQLSRLAAYYWSRCRHDAQERDDGTYPYYMAQQLQTMGVLEEKDWPNVTENLHRRIPAHLIVRASNNRISGVYPIERFFASDRLDMVEGSLRGGMPVVASAKIHLGTFENVKPGDVVDAPTKVDGNHMMLIVGVRIRNNGVREFLLRNSWGEYWGDKGHTWITQNYAEGMWDLYMLTLMEDLVH